MDVCKNGILMADIDIVLPVLTVYLIAVGGIVLSHLMRHCFAH